MGRQGQPKDSQEATSLWNTLGSTKASGRREHCPGLAWPLGAILPFRRGQWEKGGGR